MHRLLAITSFVCSLASAGCATEAAQATVRSDGPEAVVRQHIAAQNAHSIDAILGTLADTVTVTVPRTGGDSSFHADRAAQRAMFSRSITALPSSHLEILNVLVSGRVVVTRERLTGFASGASDVGASAYWVTNGRIVREQILSVSERSVSP